jgi:hypothetical protein
MPQLPLVLLGAAPGRQLIGMSKECVVCVHVFATVSHLFSYSFNITLDIIQLPPTKVTPSISFNYQWPFFRAYLLAIRNRY